MNRVARQDLIAGIERLLECSQFGKRIGTIVERADIVRRDGECCDWRRPFRA
jgi:hypothetical protein